VPGFVANDTWKVPVLLPLSENVIPLPAGGESDKVSLATGEASTVTSHRSTMPSGATYVIGSLVNVGARGVA
jgi:hypothetical protein